MSLFNFDVIVPMDLHRSRTQQAQQQQSGAGGSCVDLSDQAGAQAAGADGSHLPAKEAAAAAATEEPVCLDLRAAAEALAAAAAKPVQQQPEERRQQQQQEQQPQQQQPGEEGEREELLYHLIDINYFPGGCPGAWGWHDERHDSSWLLAGCFVAAGCSLVVRLVWRSPPHMYHPCCPPVPPTCTAGYENMPSYQTQPTCWL